MRNSFLRQERARAALLKSGIFWCFAVDSLRLPLALIGSSSSVVDYAQVLHSSSGDIYVDDDLSEEEMSLICGVYRVYTRTHCLYVHSNLTNHSYIEDTGKQTKFCSWWPRACAWTGGGLNVGYWSQGCEFWFQSRLQLICEGKAHSKSPTQWRDTLKKTRTTIKTVSTIDKLANSVLNSK